MFLPAVHRDRYVVARMTKIRRTHTLCVDAVSCYRAALDASNKCFARSCFFLLSGCKPSQSSNFTFYKGTATIFSLLHLYRKLSLDAIKLNMIEEVNKKNWSVSIDLDHVDKDIALKIQSWMIETFFHCAPAISGQDLLNYSIEI